MPHAPTTDVVADAPSTFSRVVVADDGGPLAASVLPLATWVAKQAGAPLTRLRVVRPGTHAPLEPDLTVVQHRDPARTILAEARQPGTLVALATHARGPVGAAILGSTAESVVRESGRPLLVVGPRHDPSSAEINRVVACVDGSPTSASIVATADAWARDLDVPLVLLHVALSVQGDGSLAVLAGSLTSAARTETLVASEPAAAVAAYAAEVPGTLLALATFGGGGLRGVAVGSVAARVARQVSGPLLLRRPEA